MQFSENISLRFILFSLTAISCLINTNSQALSRMGTAKISNIGGIPCFSIPNSLETKNGLPLNAIIIRELPKGNNESLPPTMWSFGADNREAPPLIFPNHCIRYGENPAGTTQHTLISLELLKVYSVFIKAKHKGSSMIGYTGEFCVKPAGPGRTFVQVIPEDPRLGEARFSGCIK